MVLIAELAWTMLPIPRELIRTQEAVQHPHSPEPQSPFHVYKRTAYVMSVLIPVPVPDSQHGFRVSVIMPIRLISTSRTERLVLPP